MVSVVTWSQASSTQQTALRRFIDLASSEAEEALSILANRCRSILFR